MAARTGAGISAAPALFRCTRCAQPGVCARHWATRLSTDIRDQLASGVKTRPLVTRYRGVTTYNMTVIINRATRASSRRPLGPPRMGTTTVYRGFQLQAHATQALYWPIRATFM